MSVASTIPEVELRRESAEWRPARSSPTEVAELLSSLAPVVRRAAPSEPLPSWERLTPLLGRHQLEALVWARHPASGRAAPAAMLPNSFRRAYLANLRRNAVFLEEARRVQSAAGSIPIVFLQGAAMISRPGADAGERQLSDLDVLVAPEDARQLLPALAALGYGSWRAARFLSWAYEGHWELRREQPGGRGLALDVSCGTTIPVSLFTRLVRRRGAGILQRRRTSGEGIEIPDASDLLTLTLLNIEQKDFGWLKLYIDVADLTCDESAPIDWDRVVAELATIDGLGMAGAILERSRDWFGAKVPDCVLRAGGGRWSLSVRGWERYFLAPRTVAAQSAVGYHGRESFPAARAVLIGIARRYCAIRSIRERFRVLASCARENFEPLNDYLFHFRSRPAVWLAKRILNPCFVYGGYALCLVAFVVSGLVLCARRDSVAACLRARSAT